MDWKRDSAVHATLWSSAERLQVVEVAGRARVDDPVDDVEDDERERKTLARQLVNAPRAPLAGVHVDGRARRRHDDRRRRRAGTGRRRRLAVRRPAARPQLRRQTDTQIYSVKWRHRVMVTIRSPSCGYITT